MFRVTGFGLRVEGLGFELRKPCRFRGLNSRHPPPAPTPTGTMVQKNLFRQEGIDLQAGLGVRV